MHEKTIKNHLLWYVSISLFVFISLYCLVQFILFSKEYEKSFLKEAYQAQDEFEYFLNNYKLILEKLSQEIRKKSLFTNSQELAQCLQKAYVHGVESEENKEKIRAFGVNWVGIDEPFPISHLGQMRSKLKFHLEYLEKLKNNHGELQISEYVHSSASLPSQVINFGIGIRDHEKYQGFINARVDIGHLIEKLKHENLEQDYQIVLLDEKSNIIASSISLASYEIKKATGLNIRDIPIKKFSTILSTKDHMFSVLVKVNQFPYFLLIGYERKQFFILFLKNTLFQIIVLFLFSLAVLFFTYFYHKHLIQKFVAFSKGKSKENTRLISHTEKLESFIKSAEGADLENKKFQLDVNQRVSRSFSDLLSVGDLLLKIIEEGGNIQENRKDLMTIFEKAYTHSRFFCVKNEETSLEINEVLNEACTIFSKRILKKDLYIIKNIQESTKNILTDRLSVKQVVINILARSIQNSPREGKIELHFLAHKNAICLECKDNGYVEGHQLSQNFQEGKKESIDCMFLDWEDLQILVKSLEGTLSVQYTPYQGNHFIFSFPYQMSKKQINKEIKKTNNVLNSYSNVIPFAQLKKDKTP